MRARRKIAVACAALVTAAGAMMVATPAQAHHAAGYNGFASAELRVAAQPITSLQVCVTDGDGKPIEGLCKNEPLGVAGDSVKLALNYTLLKTETHIPSIDTAAGLIPAADCPAANPPSTLQNRPGLRVLATNAKFQNHGSWSVQVSKGGAPVHEHPIASEPMPSPVSAPGGTGVVLCLL